MTPLPRLAGRLTQVRALIRPVARTTRWQPLAASGLAGAVIALIQTRDPCLSLGSSCVSLSSRITAARVAGLLIAIGAAFLLDDPAEETTAHIPTALWLRRSLRIVLGLPLIALMWTLSIWAATSSAVEGGQGFPVAELTLELAAWVTVGLAVSAIAADHVPEGLGGVAAGPVLLGVAVLVLLLPTRFQPLVDDPGNHRWRDGHELWAMVLAASTAALGWSSRDRWRRRWLTTRGAGRSRGSRTPPDLRRPSGRPARSSAGPAAP
jgi:hypothetical protein